MTAFDDRFYHTLVTLAAGTGRVQVAVRELADILDVSVRSVRASLERLASDGRISIIRSSETNVASVITFPNSPLDGGLTGELGSQQPHPVAGRAAYPHTVAPTNAGKPGESPTPKRDVDPGCPVCEGTGWVFLPQASNTVDPCHCLSHEYRAWWRAQRRRTLNSWPRRPSNDEPPSKSDYNATMLEWNRRQVKEADALRKAVERHPATPPDPDPAF